MFQPCDGWKLSHQYGLTKDTTDNFPTKFLNISSRLVLFAKPLQLTNNVVDFGICPRFNKLLSLSVPNALITIKKSNSMYPRGYNNTSLGYKLIFGSKLTFAATITIFKLSGTRRMTHGVNNAKTFIRSKLMTQNKAKTTLFSYLMKL